MADTDDRQAGDDLFVSYSRRDGEFVGRLVGALESRGHRPWVDKSGIRPTAKWMDEVRAAIEAASAFLYVISPDSVASDVCAQEIAHAAELNKRVLPVLHRDVDAGLVPESATTRNWIFARTDDELEGAVEALCAALDTDPDWARLHSRLVVRALEWDAAGRDPSFALRGSDLDAAERWLAEADERKDPQPTRLHREYIAESRQVATRNQRRRTAALTVGLVVASTLAVVAFFQYRRAQDEANVARSRELAQSALLEEKNNPDLSLALAIEATKIAPTAQAERALRESLLKSFVLAVDRGHDAPVNGVAISPDGSTIATGGSNRTVRLWQADGSPAPEELDVGRPVNGVAFSPDGTRLAVAADDGSASIWDARKRNRLLDLRGHTGRVFSARFSADGSRLVSAGADGTARVWDARSGSQVAAQQTARPLYSAVFSPTEDRVAYGGRAGTLSVWKPGSERAQRTIRIGGASAKGQQADEVNGLDFSPDGRRILVAPFDGNGRVIDVRSGETKLTLPAGRDEIYGAAFGPDGLTAVTASQDQKARVWDVSGSSGKARLTRTLLGHQGGVNAAAFAPDGRTVATASDDGTARLWQAESDDSTLTYRAHSVGVVGVAVRPHGTEVATTGLDGVTRLWDARTGHTLAALRAHRQDVWSPSFSASGSRLVTANGDGTGTVWDVPTDTRDTTLGRPGIRGVGAAISPDGRLAVTSTAEAAGKPVRVWEVASGKQIAAFDQNRRLTFSAAFSPDGRLVATTGSDNLARIWVARTGEQVGQLSGHTDWVRDAEWSSEGTRMVTASEDGTARIWDAETGRQLQVLRGHSAAVLSAVFSPDNAEVATGSADRTVRVWDADSGALLDILRGPYDWVNDVAYAPDGRIYAASYDATAREFECTLCVPLDGLLAIAERRSTRALTPAERERFLHE